MSPSKQNNSRKKLEDDLARAARRVHQAMLAGKINPGGPKHPSMKRLEMLSKRKVEARARAIRRLKSLDQDKLFERWKFFRQKQGEFGLTREEFEKYRELKLHFLKHPHPEIARIEKRAGDQMNLLQQQVKAAIQPPLKVRYSAYHRDKLGIPINNLNDIAVTGRVRFVYDPNALPDIPCPIYRSKVVKDPTWLQVAQLANDMIQTCELTEHVYLENIHLEKETGGIKELCFVMGS